MTNQITNPINFYKVDDFVPVTMFAPALEFEHDAYSIMEINCEFGHAFFINLNPLTVEMMNTQELRQLVINALTAYEASINKEFENDAICLQHYLDQATPVVDAATSVSQNKC